MSDTPVLEAGDWCGPLEALLEEVRRRTLDVRALPLMQLIEQFSECVESGMTTRPLERTADWLVLASTLVQLRSSLMLRPDTEGHQTATEEGERLRSRVLRGQALDRAVEAFGALPRLGEHVFARGGPASGDTAVGEQALLAGDFLDALLSLYRRRLKLQPQLRDRAGMPAAFECLKVSEALVWWRSVLQGREDEAGWTLEDGLAGLGASGNGEDAADPGPARRNAAKAAHFLAALELGKQGEVRLDQASLFAQVKVTAAVL
ncbi:hypothetical protein [Acetobacter nitrogenifigens]|uniref:Segregation and condensation protein A n=1 Tax=Acetobacter nitrogenifigens DSM 23921 = NBRC 105050 TaxID=1120919 RepID=A0A511XF76_9PROT|nr:hypothetical protein [Acetobacter nitrogenifigens]GEN61604.1 segregation and condensation protein A [Acetobacter nitrogenifigens DSM 23921 = NBRC 105050]